jgi:Zn-dependent peptidase ImmA (M78 family)
MKKYFYSSGIDKLGPFSYDELKELSLTRETKIWYYGLEEWTSLSDIDHLKEITNSIPPSLNFNQLNKTNQLYNYSESNFNGLLKKQDRPLRKVSPKMGIWVTIIVVIAIVLGVLSNEKRKSHKLYNEIKASAYDSDADFDFYVKKFYRDLEYFGIFPKKPKTTIIKLAKLDQLGNATHFHGVSFGMKNDDRIEIYINHSSWESFNKPMRYFLMYHELSHDVLNLDDLKELPSNEGKLMYPAIATYQPKTMDDFIESFHELFEEFGKKQSN